MSVAVNHLFPRKRDYNLTSHVTAPAVCKWQEVSELNVDELCRPGRLFMALAHAHSRYNVTQHAEEMPINIH